MPAQIPLGFPVTQFLGEERAAWDAPLPQSLVARNTVRVEQFLNVPITESTTLVQPTRVLNDNHEEEVTVSCWFSRDRCSVSKSVKATPLQLLTSKPRSRDNRGPPRGARTTPQP